MAVSTNDNHGIETCAYCGSPYRVDKHPNDQFTYQHPPLRKCALSGQILQTKREIKIHNLLHGDIKKLIDAKPIKLTYPPHVYVPFSWTKWNHNAGCCKKGCGAEAVYVRQTIDQHFGTTNYNGQSMYCADHIAPALDRHKTHIATDPSEVSQVVMAARRRRQEREEKDRFDNLFLHLQMMNRDKRILVMSGVDGTLWRNVEDDLELLTDDGEYHPMCCYTHARHACGNMMRGRRSTDGHDETCPNAITDEEGSND